MVAAKLVVPSWEYGVLFGFLGSIVASASKLAIRKSWLLLQTTTDEYRVALALRWCGLLALSVVGPVLDLLALSHANPSLLAPFAGLSLAWVVLFSQWITGERVEAHQVRASALVGVGLLLTTACGDHVNPNEHATVDDLVRSSLLFAGCMVDWFFFCAWSERSGILVPFWSLSLTHTNITRGEFFVCSLFGSLCFLIIMIIDSAPPTAILCSCPFWLPSECGWPSCAILSYYYHHRRIMRRCSAWRGACRAVPLADCAIFSRMVSPFSIIIGKYHHHPPTITNNRNNIIRGGT